MGLRAWSAERRIPLKTALTIPGAREIAHTARKLDPVVMTSADAPLNRKISVGQSMSGMLSRTDSTNVVMSAVETTELSSFARFAA